MPKKKIYSAIITWLLASHTLLTAGGDSGSVDKAPSSADGRASSPSSDPSSGENLHDNSAREAISPPKEKSIQKGEVPHPIANRSGENGMPSISAKPSFSPYAKKENTGEKNFPIEKITITVDGLPPQNEDFIRSHIRFTEGDAFNPYVADGVIHSLAALGMFDDINISADQNDNGTLHLKLSLVTRPKIEAIEFPHRKINNKKLKQEIKTVSGEYLNEASLNDDVQTIYNYYQMQGFPKPTITTEIIPSTTHPKYVKIIFDIIPGEGKHISKIEFLDFGDVNTEKIKKQMLLKTWSIFSFLTKKGYFSDILLDIDREKVTDAMHNAGYLDAKIIAAEFKPIRNQRGMLQFRADLGQKYYFGKITFTGNKIFPDDKIEPLLKNLKTGNAFSSNTISNAMEAIRQFYGYNGHVDSYVSVEKIPTFVDNGIDVKLTIHESPPAYVNSVMVNGNYKTKNKVILRELALSPGDKFNQPRMKSGENRLKNTGFFESVEIDASDSTIPMHKNVQIDVKEKNTGTVKLGGAISARHNQFVFMEISQSNFDIFGSKAKFQGGGQKARARAQIGTREHQLVLSFEEPYLFDRELAFGVDVFGNKTRFRASDSNYSGPTYDESSIGFEPYFRKRLYELWVGRLAYNFTHKNIRNVSPKAVQPLQDEAGKRNSSRIKFSIERDTRNSYIFPRKGSFLGVDTQTAGLGGQTKLFKATANAMRWFIISEKYDHNLALVAKIGAIFPFSGEQTPYTERHFLGGDAMMRGFEFREISPKTEIERQGKTVYGDALGGNSFVYGCAEYTFNLFDDFYGAVFLEAGNVGTHQRPFADGMNVDAGLGLRIFIMNMPLRLDWGYPIHCTENTKKKGIQFNFSFGASF
ncbi:MAG: outer membrane protein assembly factor BamA [Puniceicoccales bacterium]|jgi:outer membrane protein insertion porin family|nr:outer membrane protein assembly factor BamA [Puniceicoccales bacterium]